MKKLLIYLRPYRLQAILAPCFKLLEAAFELLVPLIMGVYRPSLHEKTA